MAQELFEVGDRVFFTVTHRFGTITKLTINRPRNAPDADGVRGYDIKLDSGGTIRDVYRDIQRAQP